MKEKEKQRKKGKKRTLAYLYGINFLTQNIENRSACVFVEVIKYCTWIQEYSCR
jgi:hypothetical protein